MLPVKIGIASPNVSIIHKSHCKQEQTIIIIIMKVGITILTAIMKIPLYNQI